MKRTSVVMAGLILASFGGGVMADEEPSCAQSVMARRASGPHVLAELQVCEDPLTHVCVLPDSQRLFYKCRLRQSKKEVICLCSTHDIEKPAAPEQPLTDSAGDEIH